VNFQQNVLRTIQIGARKVDILVLICYLGALEVKGMAFVGPSLSQN
jgi:hypothetical protein